MGGAGGPDTGVGDDSGNCPTARETIGPVSPRTPVARGQAQAGPVGRPALLGLASAVSVALTWLLQAVAGHLLGPASFAAFMVVWGFVFLEIGLLLGLQQEVTRAVAADRGAPVEHGGRVGPVVVAAGIGILGGLVCLAGVPLWGSSLFGDDRWPVAVALAVGLLAFAVYNAVNGVLAGAERWTDYSLSIVMDAVLRIAVLAPVLVAAAGVVPQSWALTVPALAWVLLLPRRGVRHAVAATVPGGARSLASGAGHAMVATGCSAVMVAGFPVLLQVTARAPLGPEAGVVIAAVIATRAPLLLPLGAFQAVILTRFVLAGPRLLALVGRLLVLVAAGTAVGVVAGALLGPFLLRVLYGDAFRVGGGLVAALVLGAGLIAAQTVTGSAVMARRRHRVFAAGWLLATAVAVVVLSTGLAVGARSALALGLGPAVGLVVNLLALRGQPR